MRIYLDSVVTIYFVERVQPYLPRVQAKIGVPGAVLLVSDLTRMECRVHPIMKSDPARLRQFDTFFASVLVVDLPTWTFDRATEIRAAYGFKTADSIHLAAAVDAGCQQFLTNDAQLKRFTGLAVELV